jgi:hypothetical protein
VIARASRNRATRWRLADIEVAEYNPCFSAFLFPFGAPGEGPPCILQRPFAIPGDWHGFPLRVRARHFDPRGIGDCTGLFLHFLSGVPPFCLHGSNDRLSAVIDGHVGDGEPLLSTRSVSLQRLIFFCLDCRLEVSLRCPRSSVFLGNHRRLTPRPYSPMFPFSTGNMKSDLRKRSAL